MGKDGMIQFPDFTLEEKAGGLVAGIDEAGRGPWAGSVVAAAVILDRNQPLPPINDSKKMTRSQREICYEWLIQNTHYGVGISSVAEIDALNILGATKLAMLRAFGNLPAIPDVALIDGNQLPDLPCKMQAVVKGDSLSLSIAAASIIAKVTRDRMMESLAQEFPYYAWEKNAGYGTKLHQEGLARYGISPHHRRSFAPVKKLL